MIWAGLPILFFGFWVWLQEHKHEPHWVYMPDMVYSPAVKTQSEGVPVLLKVPGTVPRDFYPYPYAPDEQEKAGRELKNPLKRSHKVLAQGQKMYDTYCLVCHGKGGAGDGPIIPKFSKPPSLFSEKVRAWSDGMLYHQITVGKNLMSGYASQIIPEDRWAVVHYLRVLQRAQHPTPADLQAFEGVKP